MSSIFTRPQSTSKSAGPRPGRRPSARIALAAVAAISIFAATSPQSVAQSSSDKAWTFLLSSGTVVPTGAQREAIKRGNLTTAQLSYAVHPALAFTATLGWARSRDVATIDHPKLDVFTYDLGAEVRAPRWHEDRLIAFRPFAGMGAGARSYDYRKLESDATHNLAAFGSIGGELDVWRIRLRIEARDYVSGFRPLDGIGTIATRNDVVLLVGLSLVKR